MGHCIESGYAVVSEDDRVTVLDSEATKGIVEIARTTPKTEGVKIRVKRSLRDGSMKQRQSKRSRPVALTAGQKNRIPSKVAAANRAVFAIAHAHAVGAARLPDKRRSVCARPDSDDTGKLKALHPHRRGSHSRPRDAMGLGQFRSMEDDLAGERSHRDGE